MVYLCGCGDVHDVSFIGYFLLKMLSIKEFNELINMFILYIQIQIQSFIGHMFAKNKILHAVKLKIHSFIVQITGT